MIKAMKRDKSNRVDTFDTYEERRRFIIMTRLIATILTLVMVVFGLIIALAVII